MADPDPGGFRIPGVRIKLNPYKYSLQCGAPGPSLPRVSAHDDINSDAERWRPEAAEPLSGTNLRHAGDHNRRVVFDAVRLHGPVTRLELADLTGLTPPAIANISNRLVKDGLVRQSGRTRGARGQPAIKLVANTEHWFCAGLDVAADHLTLAVIDIAGTVRAQTTRDVQRPCLDGARGFARRSMGGLLKSASIQPQQLLGLGIALSGEVAGAWGRPAGDSERCNTDPIARAFASTLKVPVFVERNVTAAALGELLFGAGRRHRSFYWLELSDAAGGCLLIDGELAGVAGRGSASPGLLPVQVKDSSVRTLQDALSISALYARLRTAGHRVSTPRGLTRLDAHGRAIREEWFESAVQGLRQILAAIHSLIGPQAVIVGGDLPANILDALLERLSLGSACAETANSRIPIVARALNLTDAAAIGAAGLPFSHRLLPRRAALVKPRT